ncbi:MAG: hypothetical protein Q9163_005630 [Psora crenata]
MVRTKPPPTTLGLSDSSELTACAQAYVPMALGYEGVEMYQKGHAQSVFGGRSTSRPVSMVSDVDTEFEEDDSDCEDYQGRRSEESFGNTTISTFEELRTPASNDFQGFNFGLPVQPEKSGPLKPVQGPVGPHLFRYSQESLPQQEFCLEWSPVESPRRAGPASQKPQSNAEVAPSTGIPLETWTSQQVAGWMKRVGFEEAIIDRFRINDISGGILKHLQFGDLKELGIASFGQRHQLWDEIRNLRGGLGLPSTPPDDCYSPLPRLEQGSRRQSPHNECPNPSGTENPTMEAPKQDRRRARRALRPDDVISPAESASIVAIEQLLPEPHHCSKGEDCPKWRKYKRKMDKIAREFPLELEQIGEANASPSEATFRPTSEAVPSVVASSDLLGPGNRPALRLDEDVLRVVKNRDPQENVRQFLNFQHMAESPPEPTTPPYEMFPALSPPSNTQAPHENLSRLPRLHIPKQASQPPFQDGDRTIIEQHRSPITAVQNHGEAIYRFASPASAMDVPVTAIAPAPIERDISNSVPPDMHFGGQSISRSLSRGDGRVRPLWPLDRSQSTQPLERSASCSQRRPQPNFSTAAMKDRTLSPIKDTDDKTPTLAEVNHAGWMKKRRTKMLRHEWQENHFRLKGTTLAMHRDSKTLDALELIDVDEYSVACSSIASNKLNSAFKSLKISSNKKKAAETDASAFTFQLVPAPEKKGLLGAATGKTHHFAVKKRDERIDWMRELMLAKALKQKVDGCEVNVNGHAIA